MDKRKAVKPYDRQKLNRLVMQHDMAAYMRARHAQQAEADGQKSVGESV